MSGGRAATVSVVDSAGGACPEIRIVDGSGNAKVVTWPGNGASHRTFHLVDLGPGSRTIPLQHDGESVYYVIGGSGAIVDIAAGSTMDLVEGSMVHIGKGDAYLFQAQAGAGMKILGGPCPGDSRLYEGLDTGGQA